MSTRGFFSCPPAQHLPHRYTPGNRKPGGPLVSQHLGTRRDRAILLTVLGTGTIAFSPNRSCAAYYVEAGSAKLLMDCGSGTTRRLAELGVAWQQITHVALTHFHIRHHQDLPSIMFAWKYGQPPPSGEPGDAISS